MEAGATKRPIVRLRSAAREEQIPRPKKRGLVMTNLINGFR
jgi:hypothetical protein